MNDKILRQELDALQRGIDRLDNKINPKFHIDTDVQHSLIWGSVIVIVVFIICFLIKIMN